MLVVLGARDQFNNIKYSKRVAHKPYYLPKEYQRSLGDLKFIFVGKLLTHLAEEIILQEND